MKKEKAITKKMILIKLFPLSQFILIIASVVLAMMTITFFAQSYFFEPIIGFLILMILGGVFHGLAHIYEVLRGFIRLSRQEKILGFNFNLNFRSCKTALKH